ncbi:dihydrolipoyl dehydrogenase [Clostridium magnum]|uniref:Dihydrolipoyl dehydrogenase n=1 Tax=Clostridium magnum DSM 2767 TaxID=1121326 RepID=A0A162TEZ9_9CLOT|nr:dihydrolipoyl dehydrogenase [Clostridium magnum]KZL92561.1 dihydrolipoyl dehydrogenase [Clostridium magnum DSM 2767]SHI81280.1 dihydrolipoamide dehydrogenase [Clostridium magnum DSM 2767]
MAIKVLMPKLGLTMTEGVIAKWYKKVGDSVKAGETLFEVTTDKLTNEIESDYSGIILKLCADEGDAVSCTEAVAYIGQAGEKIEDEVFDENEKGEKTAKEVDKEAGKISEEINVVVIGGGPGGYVAGIRAAQLGAKVTLIEKSKMGGTCLNVGCIPTKALLHSADVYTEAKNAAKVGIKTTVTVDWKKVQSHKNKISSGLSKGVAGLMAANNIKVLEGTAEFVNSSTLKIVKTNGVEETVVADKIIVASGSISEMPQIPGINSKNCIDSTGALELPEIPKSMVVIGGGVIGIELASLYSTFGTKVIVIEQLPKLLSLMDQELAGIIEKKLTASGIEIYKETQVLSIEDSSEGVRVRVYVKENEMCFEAEKVVVAVGRCAYTEALKLENAGIANDEGAIRVNSKQQTSVANIYAVGDCLGKEMLAHIASAQGEVAAENVMGIESIYNEKTNPFCVYTNPEFAGVGLTEEKAKERKIDYLVGKFPLIANGKSKIMGCSEGMIKIIVDSKYKEILGVHIVGPRATDLITEGALAIRLEATIDELISTIHAHPTVGEAVKEAALAIEKRAIHFK